MNYAITARKTTKPITKQHYLDYLDKISDLGNVGNVNFETTRGLHLHFQIKCKERIPFPKFRPTKRGWNVKAVPIYNMKSWEQYCRKDRYSHENNDPRDEGPQIIKKNLFKLQSLNK